VLPRPTCQRLTVVLPLTLPHPTADTGPPTHPALLVSRAAPRRPRPAALPCSATTGPPTPDGRGSLPSAFICLMLPTDTPGPLSPSHFPPSTWHRPRTPHSLFLPLPALAREATECPSSLFHAHGHLSPQKHSEPLPLHWRAGSADPQHQGPGSTLDFGPPSPLSASWVGSHARWVLSPIRAARTPAIIPRSCRVFVKSPATARRASPSTTIAGPPSFPPPRRHPTLTMIPALLLLPDRSPVLHRCSTRRPRLFPSTGEPLPTAPQRRPAR
jgi:hypothetical protein